MHQLRDQIEDIEEEKRNVDVMVQRANEALHRTQGDLTIEQEARNNQERACQTLTRRIVELEVSDLTSPVLTPHGHLILSFKSYLLNITSTNFVEIIFCVLDLKKIVSESTRRR